MEDLAPLNRDTLASTAQLPAGAGPLPSVPGYEILGELGRGGMGVVYRARQIALNRLVALKVLLHAQFANPESRRRFQIEAEAVARLQHPHIVQIYEMGEYSGLPYFSLEYCPGGSLATKLSRKPQSPRDAARLVETLARAVHAAHQQNIIHRDLKPANILIAKDEGGGMKDENNAGPPSDSSFSVHPSSLKIADFGLAKKLDDRQTHTGAVLGTPAYMAPEQRSGRIQDIGPATDVHALGVLLYEMLTGKPPFEAPTAMQTLAKVEHDEPVAVRQLQPGCPADLETICLKCLQKEPGRRYPSALELADELQRFQEQRPIKAESISLRSWIWNWCR